MVAIIPGALSMSGAWREALDRVLPKSNASRSKLVAWDAGTRSLTGRHRRIGKNLPNRGAGEFEPWMDLAGSCGLAAWPVVRPGLDSDGRRPGSRGSPRTKAPRPLLRRNDHQELSHLPLRGIKPVPRIKQSSALNDAYCPQVKSRILARELNPSHAESATRGPRRPRSNNQHQS